MKNTAIRATVALPIGAILAFCGTQAKANFIVNGDFETGDLSGWTTFVDAGGDIGASGGFPTVVGFDVDQDGSSSNAAAFRVGRDSGPVPGTRLGGGIFQSVVLGAGLVNITADIAMLDNVGSSNLDGGLVELLFDGIVVDSIDFGTAQVGVVETSMFAAVQLATAGAHEIRIRMSRGYLQGSVSPVHYIDDVAAVQSIVPGPSSLALLSIGGLSLLGFRKRRKTQLAA